MKNSNLGPNKKYYKDDNYQRAQIITSMFPLNYQPEQPEQPENVEQRNIERRQYDMWARRTGRTGRDVRNLCDRHDLRNSRASRDNYYKSRASLPIRNIIPNRHVLPIRTDFTEKEKAEILSRVIFVGIERAAAEAGTSKEIVMHWLQVIDESISEINSEWDKIEAEGGIAGYEIEYERVIERRNHYKKPLEQIIIILTRAEEVGIKQAARELKATRSKIFRWKKLFPKQIWEQVRQWAKENSENSTDNTEGNTEDTVNGNAVGHEFLSNTSIQYSLCGQRRQLEQRGQLGLHEELVMPAPETIIARAEEVGDEQAAREFRVSITTVKSLRRRAKLPPVQEIKHYTREEKIIISDRADEIGLKTRKSILERK